MVAMTAQNVNGCVEGLFEVFAKGGLLPTDEFLGMLATIAEPGELAAVEAVARKVGPTLTMDALRAAGWP